MGKKKEKPVGTAYLRWGELPSWRLVERKLEITHNFSLHVKMAFGPMQVAVTVPEVTRIPELRFSFERTHYWPGEVVKGVLTASVAQSRPIYGLQLAFDGFNYVDWYDEYADSFFHGTDIYFSTRNFLIGQKPPAARRNRERAEKNGEKDIDYGGGVSWDGSVDGSDIPIVDLPAGVTHYPFSFQLPLNLPHSMSHMDGCVGVFYFIEAKIFEIGLRKPTVARYAMTIVPPAVTVLEDPSVSRTETTITNISKHSPPLADNYSQSITSESALDAASLSDAWSPSSSLSTFDHIYDAENVSRQLRTAHDSALDGDIDLEVDDEKWLSQTRDHRNADSGSFKLRQRASSAVIGSPNRDSALNGKASGDSSRSSSPKQGGTPPASPRGNESVMSSPSGRSTRELDSSDETTGPHSFSHNSAFFFGEDDSGEDMISPSGDHKDILANGGAAPGSSKSKGLTGSRVRSVSNSSTNSKARTASIAIQAALPSVAITGKPFVFPVTIENRSGKPIVSLRVQMRSQLVLTGHTGGKPGAPLREWRSQRATIVKLALRDLPCFPIQPNTAWRGDITINIPSNLYPSVQVRHLALVYQIKVEAKSAGRKIGTSNFNLMTAPMSKTFGKWSHPITVVQTRPDKEVAKIKPPTELAGEPCKWILSPKILDTLDASVVPLPIAPDGAIPIVGYQLSSKAFA